MSPDRRLLLWLPAPFLAWWFSANSTSCPTPVEPLAAGAVLLMLGVLLATRAPHARLRHLGAVLAVLAATWLPLARAALVPGLPYMHDLAPHSWALWGTARALQAGELWPRWLDVLGFGMPVGSFYPPLPYLLGAIPIALGVPWPDVLVGLDATASLLGAAGLAWVVRARGGAATTCLIAAVAFVLAPYRLLDQGYRFALGELFGLALIAPCWHLLATLALGRGTGRTLPAAAAVIAALALTHPLSLITAAFGAGVWAVWMRPSPATSTRAVAAVLLGAALAGAHLLPAWVEQGEARIAAVVPNNPSAYQAKALHPTHVLHRSAWHGLRVSPTLEEEAERLAAGKQVQKMPHYLGWVLAWPLLLTLLVRPSPDGPADARAMAAVALVCLVATWPGPAWLMGHLPPVRSLQFPWRFLGPTSVASVLVFAAWFDPVLRSARGPTVALFLTVALAMDASHAFHAPAWIAELPAGAHHRVVRASPTCDRERPVTGYDATLPKESSEPAPAPPDGPRTEGAPWRGHPTGDLNERVQGMLIPPVDLQADVTQVQRAQPEFFTPALARRVAKGVTDGSPTARAEAGVTRVLHTDGRIEHLTAWPRVRLHTADGIDGLRAVVSRPSPSTATLTLPEGHPGGLLVWTEQAFPGWTVTLDEGAPAEPAPAEGWLAVEVGPQTRAVTFHYGASTPARQAGIAVSAFALLLWGALLRQNPWGSR